MKKFKNSVQLTGFLGSDPEVRSFAENKKVANVSIAVGDYYKSATGEMVTDTQWFNLVFWGRLAAFAEEKLGKGIEIALEGKLSNRSYIDKEGATRYTTEVTVREVLILKPRDKAQAEESPEEEDPS